MGIPIFNKILCCFSPETFGQVIGWIYAVNGLVVAFFYFAVSVVYWILINDANERKKKCREIITQMLLIEVRLEISCGAFMVFSFWYACWAVLVAIAGVLMAFGTRHEKPNRMIMLMVLLPIGAVFNFVQILLSGMTVLSIAMPLAAMLINIYLFLCIYSVYIKTKNKVKFRRVF